MHWVTPGQILAREAGARLIERARREAAAGGPGLQAMVAETLYEEQRRVARAPDDARTRADKQFIERLRRGLIEEGAEDAPRLFELAVRRYTREIEGHFEPAVYRLATTVLPFALNALLHGVTPVDALFRIRELPRLDDRVIVDGAVETLRRLAHVGTVVLAPTHVSNLDSVLLGWAIFKLGLPPFIYGAGLNLFESKILGLFMRNLGAYTIDRSKTDPLYKSLVKEYATVALEHGQHALFFPGATRSRSGALERKLKKGLLGATLTAFRENVTANRADPRVFIFPCTVSYPLVLEASSLVDQFLSRAGEARYVRPRDESEVVERWRRFLRNVLSLDLDVHLRISRPIDPFGCAVDDEGESLDPRGRRVDPTGYLREEGAIVEDDERDRHYTGLLEEAIVRAYRRDNVALATSVVSYALLHLVGLRHPRADVFRLLGLIGPGTSVARADLVATVRRALTELRSLADRGEIALSNELSGAELVVDRALATFRTYHRVPVIEARGAKVAIGNPRLLYYYRNRLDGYGLLGAPSFLPEGAP